MTRLPVVWPLLTGDVHQHWPGKRWWQKPGPWCRIKDRLGRRGTMLLVLGLTYVMLGYGEFVRVPQNVPGAWHLRIPPAIRGSAWVLTGLVASFFATVRPYRDRLVHRWWHDDTAGWLALYAVPFAYILSFMSAYLTWVLTDRAAVPPHGDPMAWYNALRQAPFIVVVLICSGWQENPRRCR